MTRLLPALLLALTACQTPPGLVARATVDGRGDVRTDGRALVVVGGLSGSVALLAAGQPLVLLPAFAVERGQWYARAADGTESRGPLSQPLPAWARALYTEADLRALSALDITLTFTE